MNRSPLFSRLWRRIPVLPRARLLLEAFEDRLAPAVSILEPTPNDTLVAAQVLEVEANGSIRIDAAIGDNVYGGADVDAYSFVLTQASDILFSGNHDGIVLSVYSYDPDNYFDRNYGPLSGNSRLIAQSSVGDASVQMQLPPGTYYVIVSGEGNRWFSPVLADSGLLGKEGEYQLEVTATPLELSSDFAPRTLYGDIMPDAQLATSPRWIHVALSQDIEPGSYITIYDASGAEWYSWWTNFSFNTHEIQMELINPLPIGDYRLVVADWDSELLSIPFSVVGIEGAAEPDDTVATAKDLGAIDAGISIIHYGYIGDDSNYNLFLGDPFLFDPTSDVDMMRFEITGDSPQAVVIEAYVGRIGSPLTAGIALFKLEDSVLVPVTSATGSGNTVATDTGAMPLLNDPLLLLTLEPGVYYLAVTNNGNVVPDGSGMQYGMDGFFDPWTSHSGWNTGMSPGQYVIHISVAPASTAAPTVQNVETIVADNGALVGVRVQFSEYVNVPALANQGLTTNHDATVAPIYLRALDPNTGEEVGARYFPALFSYDPTTNTAELVLQDYLPPGIYALHVSGLAGLTNLWGVPLAGNDAASGDFVEWIEITGSERITPITVEANHEGLEDAQDLGPIFAHDLQFGLTVQRGADAGLNDEADYFKFQVVQGGLYRFVVQGMDALLELYDANGPVGMTGSEAELAPGVYWLRIGTWSPELADGAMYELILLGVPQENPVPLTLGPAPAARLQIRPEVAPSGSVAPPPVEYDVGPIVTLPTPSGSTNPLIVTAPANSGGGPGRLLITLVGISSSVSSSIGPATPSGVLSGLATSPGGAVPGLSAAPVSALVQAIGNAFFLLDFNLEGIVELAEYDASDSETSDPEPTEPETEDAGVLETAEMQLAPELWSIPLESTPPPCLRGSLGALAFFAGLLFAQPVVGRTNNPAFEIAWAGAGWLNFRRLLRRI
jgi:hypothetical protein